MPQKIPFLQMFAALRQWTELSNGVEGWFILSAAIDKHSRSAKVMVEGASGAGPNLIVQAEEALCRAYGLNSVKIEAAPDVEEKIVNQEKNIADKEGPEELEPLEDRGFRNVDCEEKTVDNAFARTEAIRRAALQKSARIAAPVKGDKKSGGKAIFGKPVTKAPTPIGELELDMGMVVVEGDVFAIDNRELKKRGACC